MKGKFLQRKSICHKGMQGKTGIAAGWLLACLVLAGCGGSPEASYETTAAADNAAYEYSDDVYEEAYTEEEYDSVPEEGAEDVNKDASGERKLIRSVSMSVETKEFDELARRITAKVSELGGYVESSNVWTDSYYGNSISDEDATREADYVLRIPKESLDSFISLVESGTNVLRKEESVDDVTLTYVDLESHKKALMTEQDRLLELLEQAQDMESILSIEERLTQVRYQIQSMESQLRTYDNQVDYSTLSLHIYEVARITTVDKQSVWSEIAGGFSNSLYNVGRGLRNFFVWLIVHLPYLVIWAAVIAVIVLIIKKITDKSKRKRGLRRQRDKERLEKLRQENQTAADETQTKEPGTKATEKAGTDGN